MTLRPDRFFDRASSIDVERDIKDLGASVVFLDIDNTIRSRADGLVPPDAASWLSSLVRHGVRVCLLSNNWHDNVYDLAEELGLPVVAKAMKPLPLAFVRGLSLMKCKVADSIMIGDQLSTDVWGAKLVGMRSYLVLPLANEDLRHTVVVRKVERAILGAFPVESANGTDHHKDPEASSNPL